MDVAKLLSAKTFPNAKKLKLSNEDLRKIFWKYKGMELEQRRKDSFWGATNQNLSKAYEKLEEQELVIERAFRLNQTYLDNIQEGLLLIDSENKILGQYSAFITGLFETEELEGRDFVDFVYPDPEGQAEDREELSGFLEIVFGSTHASDEMIHDVNPLHHKTLHVGAEKEIVIDAHFIRIVESDEVRNLMVIFQDRTQEVAMQKKLEYEATRHDSELETISAILKNGPSAFQEFLADATDTIEQLKNGINKLEQEEFRTAIFKRVHTLKGEAKYYELHFMARLANTLEDYLSESTTQDDVVDGVDVYATTERIEECISDFQDLSLKIQNFAEVSSDGKDTGSKSLLQSVEEMVKNLAAELGKEVNVAVNMECEDIPFLRKLQKPIIHIARNAIDHGIEDPMERLSAGKNPQGIIRIELKRDNGSYKIIVADDGAGIDFDEIKRKAIERGHLPQDKPVQTKDLLNLIFSPHFSSRDTNTEISGRGLGLDIVRDAVKELGGKIGVATAAKKRYKVHPYNTRLGVSRLHYAVSRTASLRFLRFVPRVPQSRSAGAV